MNNRVVQDARSGDRFRARVSKTRSGILGRIRWRVEIERSGSELPPHWRPWKRSKCLDDEGAAFYLADRELDALTRIDDGLDRPTTAG